MELSIIDDASQTYYVQVVRVGLNLNASTNSPGPNIVGISLATGAIQVVSTAPHGFAESSFICVGQPEHMQLGICSVS